MNYKCLERSMLFFMTVISLSILAGTIIALDADQSKIASILFVVLVASILGFFIGYGANSLPNGFLRKFLVSIAAFLTLPVWLPAFFLVIFWFLLLALLDAISLLPYLLGHPQDAKFLWGKLPYLLIFLMLILGFGFSFLTLELSQTDFVIWRANWLLGLSTELVGAFFIFLVLEGGLLKLPQGEKAMQLFRYTAAFVLIVGLLLAGYAFSLFSLAVGESFSVLWGYAFLINLGSSMIGTYIIYLLIDGGEWGDFDVLGVFLIAFDRPTRLREHLVRVAPSLILLSGFLLTGVATGLDYFYHGQNLLVWGQDLASNFSAELLGAAAFILFAGGLSKRSAKKFFGTLLAGGGVAALLIYSVKVEGEQIDLSLDWLGNLGVEFVGICIAGALLWRYRQMATEYMESETYQMWLAAKRFIEKGKRLSSRRDFAGALAFYQEALRCAEKTDDHLLLAQCHIDVGAMYGELEEYPIAIEHFQQGQIFAQDVNRNDLVKVTETNIKTAHKLIR